MSAFLSRISSEEIQQLPAIKFEGEIVVVDSYPAMDAVYECLSRCEIIGFDTESRASFKKGEKNEISLLQLSGGGKAFLIRLNRVAVAGQIVRLLQSAKIKKVGVALKDDLHQLQTKGKFTPKGFVDLQKIVPQYGIEELSLKKMTAIVLNGNLSKAQRLSNWNARTLTAAQLNYAATDAWVCEEIYKKLKTVPVVPADK